MGDKVLAADTRTGKDQPETVTAVLVHHDTDPYNLTVKTIHGTEVIHTTSDHLFWDPAAHRWVKAAALRKGEPLRTPSGTATAYADGGTVSANPDGWMWDLTVPGNNDHDFYVSVEAGATEVLVHNANGCPTSPKQMQRQVSRGQAPRGVERLDGANPATDDAQPHIHFNDSRSTLNQDGTWGHGDGSDAKLASKMIKWLSDNGWGIPGGY